MKAKQYSFDDWLSRNYSEDCIDDGDDCRKCNGEGVVLRDDNSVLKIIEEYLICEDDYIECPSCGGIGSKFASEAMIEYKKICKKDEELLNSWTKK